MTADDKVFVLARALEIIADDALIDGYWTDCLNGNVFEGCHAKGAPSGYYDRADARGFEAGDRPVFWTASTPDDMRGWLESCAWVARDALRQISRSAPRFSATLIST